MAFTQFANKAVKATEHKIAKLARQLALAEERQRDAIKWQQLDPASPIQQANVDEATAQVERIKGEIAQEEMKAAAQADFEQNEPALFADAAAFKTEFEQHVKALVALSERGKKLNERFRATAITAENGYNQLRSGRFKSSGGCWPAIFDDTALVETLKRFLRDAAECKVS
jgi:hypothetical protein